MDRNTTFARPANEFSSHPTSRRPIETPQPTPKTSDVSRKSLGAILEAEPNEEIYGADTPVDHVYRMVSGCVRTCHILDDGRRYIDSFYLRGELFGFENCASHHFLCEAVCASAIQVFPLKSRNPAGGDATSGDLDLLTLSVSELNHAQAQGSLLVKTATERVAAFLLQMSERNGHAAAFTLPMGRQDIADHLGLTIETVSRVFTQLEASRAILRSPQRGIVLRERNVLEQMID